jgi:hypothetical protein
LLGKPTMKISITNLIAAVLTLAGAISSQAFAESTLVGKSKVELMSGQYQITGATYTAVVPPTGLLGALTIGGKPFVRDALVINVGKEFNLPEQHVCPAITQPSPDALVCDGDKASVKYTFGADQIEMVVTAKAEPLKIFLNTTVKAEGVLAESDDAGNKRQVAVGGDRCGGYGVTAARIYFEGQTLGIHGMRVCYGPSIFRQDLPAGATQVIHLLAQAATAEDRTTFSLPPLYSGSLTVLSPLDYQVFQRQTWEEGLVTISGKAKEGCDRLEFRFIGTGADGAWHPASIFPEHGNFSTKLTLPAGGWYHCELRAMKAGVVVAAKSIEHVGVGEVFVGAGQSNSTNYGDERQQPKSGMVSTFSGKTWRLADDPQPGVHDASSKGSFWPAFGDAMAERFKVPIGVAVTGHGATGVERWQPGGELFNWMEERILQLGPQGFRMVLWHQGESDGGTPPEEYARRLQTIIEQSNAHAGWSFPWMIARVCATKGQDLLIAQGIALEGPSTDSVSGDYRGKKGNEIHFSAKGLQKHGELWAEKVGAQLDVIHHSATETKP